MPTIAAIIPTYNRKDCLEQCIDSVLAQTWPVKEIIVVDDGSTDGTADAVRQSYPQVTLIEYANGGVSVARNRGIDTAESDWMAFLDSDDQWLPRKIETQIAAIKRNPDALICHTEERWIYRGQERSVPPAYRKKGGWIFQDCLPRCAISPSTVMIHHTIFDTVGGFDESLPACEDYDFWLRICSRFPVLLVDEPLIEKYGGHPDQLSNERGLDRYRIQALETILESDSLNHANRNAAIKTLVSKCQIYAQGALKHGRQEEAERYLKLISRYRLETESE